GRTVGGRAAARVAAATPCRAGRRRAGQRRDCVDPLPLCCRRRGDRRVLVSGSGRHLCAHRYWRNFVRHCDWLVELASAAMGTRAACGNNAVPDDALRRLLGAPTSRWLGCAGHGRVRSLRKLDRAAPDFLGYAAAGHLFLGFAVYLIEGLVFLLTGLEVRALLEQTQSLPIGELVMATVLTTLIAIAARFIWVFPATYIPRWVSSSLA